MIEERRGFGPARLRPDGPPSYPAAMLLATHTELLRATAGVGSAPRPAASLALRAAGLALPPTVRDS
jgi:hypothetical protein